MQVLPPLRDVKNRPEVGNLLRNKLVRLMTHIDTDVKHCAAEFLFVLCKESGACHFSCSSKASCFVMSYVDYLQKELDGLSHSVCDS